MLDPSLIVDAFRVAIADIPTVVKIMGSADRIVAHHYLFGLETRLDNAIARILSPGMLIVWAGTVGGNFNGQEIWKHKIGVYARAGNQSGNVDPQSYERLWWA